MQTAPSNIKFSYFFLVSLDKVKVDEKFHNKPKGNFKRIKWKKTMKLNETMNLNLLSMLKMTTTFEGNKSFVVTFRRYQLNANIHDIAKSLNIYIAKA